MVFSLPQQVTLHSNVDAQKKFLNKEVIYTIYCLRTNRQEHYQLHKDKKIPSSKVVFLQCSSGLSILKKKKSSLIVLYSHSFSLHFLESLHIIYVHTIMYIMHMIQNIAVTE